MAGGPQVNDLLNMEVEERKRAIEDTIGELNEQFNHWSRPGVYVLPDTSVYINYPQKVEDWGRLGFLDIRPDVPIHVVVPIVVVEELDRLKDSGQKPTRWRARHTLAVLDRLLPAQVKWGVLTPAKVEAVQEVVTIEVVLDPPGHLRLPIADDEIVDRALAIQSLVRQSVILVTYDTAQSTRGRMAGLTVRKLELPLDE